MFLAFTFVTAAFLLDKPCRPTQSLLIYALDITVNDYSYFTRCSLLLLAEALN